ncbi:MAG: KOW motif-containing protein [Armatimonadetes bacterium]|nr:KOW motif-containing protein [Candidatus Hippobium faecium]
MALKKWYVIHTYSQHEDKVKSSIETMALNTGNSDKIGEVFLPKKIYKEVDKRGKVREKHKILYPGYLYLNICLTDDIWHLIKGIDGVTGFLGERPSPLRRSEVEAIKASLEESNNLKTYSWKVGDSVMIKTGPFAEIEGRIDKVSDNKVTVVIDFFNKETPVELGFEDISEI